MNARIEKLAKRALEKDVYKASVEYYEANTKDNAAIGRAIAEYLRIQPMEVFEDELIADRYRFDKLNVPSDYYRGFGRVNRNKYWDTHNLNCPPSDTFYWGYTHIALDFEYILNNGFQAYYDRIASACEKFCDDAEKLNFLEGMKCCLDGLIQRYTIYSEKVLKLAEAEENTEIKNNYLRISKAFEQIPLKPARSFFEAVQFTWILFLAAPDSLGRIDQYLYPFYKNDLDNGTITIEFAKELLEELFIKVHEAQYRPKGHVLEISGHNHLVVGGYLKNGEDGFNDLSKLILECIVELPTYRPQASFRFTNKTSFETMRYITEMNRKSQLIVFVNDEARIDGMVKCGVDYNDAVEYSVIGCNEWSLVGKSKMDLAHINFVHALQNTIYGPHSFESYEDLYDKLEIEMRKDFDEILAEYTHYLDAQQQDKDVLTSLFHDNCIESGTSFVDLGVKYYGLTMSYNGLSNVADSLSILKQFVFDEGRYTFEQVLDALNNNWCGYENMRNEILKEGHFFGNDDDYVDDIANDLVDSLYKIKCEINVPYIKNIFLGSFVGATSPNILLGKRTKATPDGRYDREAFTMGVSQSEGKDKNGITALLNSISKIDYAKFCGCVVSNLKIDKAMADTPEKLDRLAALYYTFLKNGGMQLQINYLSADELLKAQKTPEKYENLMVRVTGYSGFFTAFNEDLQNDIIKRTLQC